MTSSNKRTYAIHLSNQGNVPHRYRVGALDGSGELAFTVDEGPHPLEPGEEIEVPLTARVERRPWIGVPTFYPFETLVEEMDGGPLSSHSAHLRVTPRIPLWLLLLLPLLFLCAALVAD